MHKPLAQELFSEKIQTVAGCGFGSGCIRRSELLQPRVNLRMARLAQNHKIAAGVDSAVLKLNDVVPCTPLFSAYETWRANRVSAESRLHFIELGAAN